jgi:hypothetical protein
VLCQEFWQLSADERLDLAANLWANPAITRQIHLTKTPGSVQSGSSAVAAATRPSRRIRTLRTFRWAARAGIAAHQFDSGS